MTILGLRNAIISSIDAEIPAFVSVKEHGGNLNATEIKRISTKSPAALVSVLGGDGKLEGGLAVGSMAITVFIITRGSSDNKRESDVITLAESVFHEAAHNAWDYEDAQAPMNIKMRNLYNSALDGLGVALWGVAWTQKADAAKFDITTLDEFHTADTKIDLVPADGFMESESLVTVGGEFMSAYGHIYISTAAATPMVASDTYYKAAGSTTLKLSSDCDMPVDGRIRHIGTVSKPFLATASIAVQVSADALVTLALAKNGVVDEDTAIKQEVTLAGGAEALSLKGIMSLDENEYAEVWVKADSTVDVTLSKLNLAIVAT